MDWLGESRNVQDATSGQASGEEGQNQDSKYHTNKLNQQKPEQIVEAGI